jgi:large subunit ribosomal protein L19
MNTKLINEVTKEYKSKVKHPEFRTGDIIEVHTKIKEGEKERIQVFKGIVIAIKGEGISKTFTVRKISYGIGVEKIYPLYSPVIQKIKILKKGKVKRSKLYYIRKRLGKKAMKAGIQIPVEGKEQETQIMGTEEEVEDADKDSKEEETKEEKSEDKENEKKASKENNSVEKKDTKMEKEETKKKE